MGPPLAFIHRRVDGSTDSFLFVVYEEIKTFTLKSFSCTITRCHMISRGLQQSKI